MVTATTPAARIATRDMLQHAQSEIAKLHAAFARHTAYGDAHTLTATLGNLKAALRAEWQDYAVAVARDTQDAKAQQGQTDKLASKPAPTVPVQAIPTAKPVSAPVSAPVAAQKPAKAKVVAPAPADVVDAYEQTVDSDEAFIDRVVRNVAPVAAQKAKPAAKPTAKPVVKPVTPVAAQVPTHISHPQYSGWAGRRQLLADAKAAGVKGLNRKNPAIIADLLAATGKPVVAAQTPAPAAKGDTTERKALLAKLATLSTEQLRDLVALVG
jgi:hypothetical protein